nr:MAG: hypothetical protein 1 [Leviviridae sp.]
MAYSRVRSRNHFNDYSVRKFGTIGDSTDLVTNIVSSWVNQRRSTDAELSSSVTFPRVGTLSISGVPVLTAGSGSFRKYRDPSGIRAVITGATSSFLSEWSEEIAVAQSNAITSSPPFLVQKSGESMTDVVTPEYRQLSRLGKIVNSPMSSMKSASQCSITDEFVSMGPGMINIVTQTQGSISGGTYQERYIVSIRYPMSVRSYGLQEGVFDSYLSSVMPNSIRNYDAQVNTAFQKAYEAEADLALAIAEFKKTASHLAGTVLRLHGIVKAIKSGKFSKLAPQAYRRWKKDGPISSVSNVFLDAWLEARYAWRPLILDVQAAYQYLSKPNGLTPRRTFRDFDQDEITGSISNSTTVGSYSYVLNGSLTRIRSTRAGILTEIDLGMSALRDLGFLNPAGVAWELVPYSFVIDWFVNVAGFLQLANPNSGVKVLSSWVTSVCEYSFTASVECTHIPTATTKNLNYSGLVVYRTRTPNVSPSFINFDVNLDVYKLVDAIALLRRFKH